MVVPTTGALVWMCVAAAAAAATTGAMLVATRLRYERRLRLLRAVDNVLTPPGEARRLISTAPLSDLRLLIRASNISRSATKQFAESLAARIGDAPLLDAATSRQPRQRGRRADALRILTFAQRQASCGLLAAALADGTPEVKRVAVALLRQIGDRRSAIVLVDALRSGSYSRSRLAAALDAFGIAIGDRIAPLLDAHDSATRFWAATLMQRYPRTPGLARRLGALSRDADPRVRKAAVVAIGAAGGAAATIFITARLADEVPFVRAHAARALARLQGVAASPVIASMLADTDWIVRQSAKECLRAMGEAVAPFVLPLLAHADAFARNSAAEILQNVGVFERLLEREIEGPTDPDRVRTLRLLAQAGGPSMVASVVDRVRHAA
jgi:HEAT repeat protein